MNAKQIIKRFLSYKKKKLGTRYTLDKVEACQVEYLEQVLKRERQKAVRDYKRSLQAR